MFITRSDSGERVVNYSGLIGPLMGEGLAKTSRTRDKIARSAAPLPATRPIWGGGLPGIYCASTGRALRESCASHRRSRRRIRFLADPRFVVNSAYKFCGHIRVQFLQTWITLFRQWNLLVQTRLDIADCVVRVKARLDRARPEASSSPVVP